MGRSSFSQIRKGRPLVRTLGRERSGCEIELGASSSCLAIVDGCEEKYIIQARTFYPGWVNHSLRAELA